MFLPVVLVLVAENVGHVRGVAAMTDATVNKHTGRALIADGVATTLAGPSAARAPRRTARTSASWPRPASTRPRSTGSPVSRDPAQPLSQGRRGVQHHPAGVLGGVTTALYGLIGIIGIKIWVDNRVDFSRPVNQYTARSRS